MKQLIQYSLLATLFVLICGCAPTIGSPEAQVLMNKELAESKTEAVETTVDKMPDWCSEVPASNVAIYACGFGTSSSLIIARSRALMEAKRILADQLTGEINSRTDEFLKSIGAAENEQLQQEIEVVTKNLVGSATLAGYKIPESKTVDDQGKFLHYILVEYPLGQANKALLANIRQNEVLSTQENSEKAMARLEAEIEKRRGL